jgi:hypothetical protein
MIDTDKERMKQLTVFLGVAKISFLMFLLAAPPVRIFRRTSAGKYHSSVVWAWPNGYDKRQREATIGTATRGGKKQNSSEA